VSRLQRSAGGVLVALGVSAATVLAIGAHRASASTAAGTVITNTSTATYSDSNSATYSTSSNTVSVTIQNAPSLTVTASTAKIVAAGQTITDTFTITNTGNASGNVALTAAATMGGSDSASSVTYWFNATSYSSYTALNAALSLSTNAVTTTTPITIGVVYTVPTTATVGDISASITGTITYAAAGNATAQTSTSATASEDDSVNADAVLDVALASVNTSGVITYTVKAADRTTTWGAKDLSSVNTLLGVVGGSGGGVFISAKIPQYPAGTPLTITGTPAVTTSTSNGFGGGTATVYTTANTTGAGGWTAGVVANATYIGVYITGGTCTNGGVASTSGIEICAVSSGTGSSAGSVPNPAVTLTFSVIQSSSSGSANTGSTTAIANSLIGDNASSEHVIAPSITQNSLLNSAATPALLTATGQGVNNVTAAASALPSGASNIDSDQSVVAYLFYNGPYGNASATGSVDGSTSDTNHDFTAVSFTSSAAYVTTDTAATYSPTTVSTTTSGSTISVENTLTNSGNKDDTYTIVAGTLPSGWTVALQTDSATPGSPSGIALGSASAGTTSTATGVSVASGASLNYWAVYSVPAGVTYLSHQNVSIVATSALSAATNATYNLLYAGFVAITTIAATTSGCPSSVTNATGTVCPGGSIQYTIGYRNIVGGSGNYDASSVPAVSFKGVSTKAGTFVLAADGTNASNWATYTNGPSAAPVDTTANTTFTYYNSTYTSGTTTFISPITKFVALVGGPSFQLVPYGYASGGAGSYGQITYSVTIK
jgi:hypothetical protein